MKLKEFRKLSKIRKFLYQIKMVFRFIFCPAKLTKKEYYYCEMNHNLIKSLNGFWEKLKYILAGGWKPYGLVQKAY